MIVGKLFMTIDGNWLKQIKYTQKAFQIGLTIKKARYIMYIKHQTS